MLSEVVGEIKGGRTLCCGLRAQVGLADGRADAGWIPSRVGVRLISPTPLLLMACHAEQIAGWRSIRRW